MTKSQKTDVKTAQKKTVSSKDSKPVKKSKIAKLEEETKALKARLSEFEDRHLRLKAEFDNFRKRKDREIERILMYEGVDIIKSFLPVIDDLERVIDSVNGQDAPNLDTLVKGMQMILDKLRNRLKNHNIESFDSTGEIFNPELHEAMMVQESKDHKDQEIIQEFEKGYKYKDKIIRHAKVVVSSNPSKDQSEEK